MAMFLVTTPSNPSGAVKPLSRSASELPRPVGARSWEAVSISSGVSAAVALTAAVGRRTGRSHAWRRCNPSDESTQIVSQRAASSQVQKDFFSACSLAGTWEKAIDEVVAAAGTGYESGFAFVSALYVDQAQGLPALTEMLREKLGLEHLVVGVTTGGIGQAAGTAAVDFSGGGAGEDWPPFEVESGPYLSIGLMQKAGAVPFFISKDAGGDTELVNRMASDGVVRALLVLGDPFGPVEQIMTSLGETFPKAVMAGGITSTMQVGHESQNQFTPSMAICSAGNKARLLSEGVCGLMLTEMEVHTIVCQGCRPAGPAVNITNVSGPVCTGIGGRPAKEAVMLIFSSVNPETQEKMKQCMTIGLGRQGENGSLIGDGDWLIRGISQVTPNGGLVVGDGIQEGQPMRFHVRDRESAESDLDLMMNRYRLERSLIGGPEPVGCFLFTCNGRGEDLYSRRHVDARAVVKALGDSVGTRVSGFFANGEIGSPGLSIPGESVRSPALHGFTAVFAMLVPAKK